MPIKERFNHNANTFEEASEYLNNRAMQLLKVGVKKEHIIEEVGAAVMIMEYDGKTYQSIYILLDYRNQGLFDKLYNKRKYDILTSTDCDIDEYLDYKGYPYKMVQLWHSQEYDYIKEFYGNQTTERTGVHLINHIDEGLGILNDLNASIEAQQAYCLHPIFQSDEALLENYNKDYQIEKYVMMLVMEYRNIANAYLSKRKIETLDEIQLSPILEVNQMLLADKIQNQKDFLIYHYGTHPRSEELKEYFENWLTKLRINGFYFFHL